MFSLPLCTASDHPLRVVAVGQGECQRADPLAAAFPGLRSWSHGRSGFAGGDRALAAPSRGLRASCAILPEAGSRYLPVAIDIETFTCTDCGDPMVAGDIETIDLVCPSCQRSSGRSLGDHSRETVFVEYRPLDDDLVPGLILYLKSLAEHPNHVHPKLTSIPPSDEGSIAASSQVLDPLWDHELDGESRDSIRPMAARRD